MGQFRVLRPSEVLRALQRAGFIVDRTSGSHVVLKKFDTAGTKTAVIPQHNRDLKRGTFHNILRQAGMSEEELFRYL